jgi:hypothetical protein
MNDDVTPVPQRELGRSFLLTDWLIQPAFMTLEPHPYPKLIGRTDVKSRTKAGFIFFEHPLPIG